MDQVEPRAIGTVARTVDPTIDERTGEPRRPVAVTLSAGAFFLGVAWMVAGLLWAFWRSVREFPEAAWLNGVVPTEPGSLLRILMVTALFAATMLVGASAIIAGHYAWRGYGWTRWAGVVAAVVSVLALLLNWVAWVAIPLAVVGSVLLWTPPARRWFAQWHLSRHPAPIVVEPARDVFYGPLPRFR